MRELKECRAEIFRRSEERIRERKRKQKCFAVWSVSLCLCVCLGAKLFLPGLGSANQVFPEGEDRPLDNVENESIFCTYVEAEILVKGDLQETVYKVSDKAEVAKMYGVILSVLDISDEEMQNSAESEDDLAEKPSEDERPEENSKLSSDKADFATESESESVLLPHPDSENSSEAESEEMSESQLPSEDEKNSELESEDSSGLPSSSETEKNSELESGDRVELAEESEFTIVFKSVDGSRRVYTLAGNCLTVQETGEQFILNQRELKELKLALGLL